MGFGSLLVAVLWTVAANAASEEPTFAWRWAEGEVHRYYFENEVMLPSPIWLYADRNRDARVVAWQVQMVAGCRLVDRSKRTFEIACKVEDFAMRAAAVPGDQAAEGRDPLVGPIVDEIDHKLSAASLQIELRSDGRIKMFDIEGLARDNERVGTMNENLRAMLSRAVAGLDLQLPADAVVPDEPWPQFQSMLPRAATQTGTFGSVPMINMINVSDGPQIVVQTVGKGVVTPDSANSFETRVQAVAVFDTAAGVLTERVWTVNGIPTAGSAVAETGGGLGYFQKGRLIRLAADDRPDVGESVEIAPPGQTPTTLHLWQPVVDLPGWME